ncbi:MFS transporter [Bailinhaonella thermotolerans]|uniref:Tetracycline resistance protein n=1 Tax=Bailinhaonella thermotolerans TaxID=1070861 RepID=A0A3A4A6M6_9ACTN|nr:MFS transporter [Bailinhaonella thermotolerans]
MDAAVAAAPAGARSAGVRVGALFGPAVFGVTAAGVALPDVGAELRAGPAEVAWVLTAHALALGLRTAFFGRLSDAWGVRRTLAAGAIVLALGTVVCLVAPDLRVLVAGRFVLAAGSGAMSACALALTAAAAPERRASMLAGFGASMAVFSAAATLAGGVVTELASWRITLVLPALSLLAAPLCAGLAVRPGTGARVDLTGAGLLTGAASAFLILIQAGTLGLPGVAAAVVGAVFVVAAAGLALRVRRVPSGFVPRRLVGDRPYLVAAAVGIGVYGGLFATMYAAPQLLVREHGMSVLAVGAWLLPGAVVGVVASRAVGAVRSPRARNTLLAAVAAAFAAVLLAAALAGGAVLLIAAASLGFAAFSTAQVAVTAIMSAHLPPATRGGGMGLLNLAFFAGGATASALTAALSAPLGLAPSLAVITLFPATAALLSLTLPRAVPAPSPPAAPAGARP